MSAETRGALARFKQTGRRLILVTGRDLPDLKRVFPELQLFDRVVAENGALIYDPATNEERPLAAAPPCVYRKLDSAILVVKATENWVCRDGRKSASRCRAGGEDHSMINSARNQQ